MIGADQILVCDGVWFDKPADVGRGARAAARAARADPCAGDRGGVPRGTSSRVWHDVAAPRLTMRDFSDAFLERYLAAEGDAVTTTVGAYRLEGRGVHLFDAIEGEHSAILGLPLLPLLAFLRRVMASCEAVR